MNGIFMLAAAAALGVDVGWRPLDDGGFEYIIQIEPELLDSLRDGQDILSQLPPGLLDVRRYRITVGTGPVPRIGEPEKPEASQAETPVESGPLPIGTAPQRPWRRAVVDEESVRPIDEPYVRPTGDRFVRPLDEPPALRTDRPTDKEPQPGPTPIDDVPPMEPDSAKEPDSTPSRLSAWPTDGNATDRYSDSPARNSPRDPFGWTDPPSGEPEIGDTPNQETPEDAVSDAPAPREGEKSQWPSAWPPVGSRDDGEDRSAPADAAASPWPSVERPGDTPVVDPPHFDQPRFDEPTPDPAAAHDGAAGYEPGSWPAQDHEHDADHRHDHVADSAAAPRPFLADATTSRLTSYRSDSPSYEAAPESTKPEPPDAAATVAAPSEEAEPKPWLALTGVMVLLFVSVGGNAYLGWMSWELRRQCLGLLERLKDRRKKAAAS